MRRVALVALLLVACREQPALLPKPKPKPVAQTQTTTPPPTATQPDNSVPIDVTNCAENHVSFVNVQPNTMQIIGADGQTVEESTEVIASDYRKEAFMIGLVATKAYVVEARLIGNIGRVERMVRCGTNGESLRVETAELKTGDAIAAPVRVSVGGTGPSKVAYRDKAGAMHEVPFEVSVGGAGSDVDGPAIHLKAVSIGKLVEMTIAGDDPSGVASIRYMFNGVQTQMEPYTEPLKFDPRLWSNGEVIAADKAGNRTQVHFAFR